RPPRASLFPYTTLFRSCETSIQVLGEYEPAPLTANCTVASPWSSPLHFFLTLIFTSGQSTVLRTSIFLVPLLGRSTLLGRSDFHVHPSGRPVTSSVMRTLLPARAVTSTASPGWKGPSPSMKNRADPSASPFHFFSKTTLTVFGGLGDWPLQTIQ